MVQANTAVVNSETVMRSINEVALENVASCTGGTSVIQKFHVTGDNNFIENVLVDQEVESHIECYQSVENQVKMLNDLVSKLAQKANTQSEFLLAALSINTSVVDQATIQEVVSKYMVKTIQTCDSTFNYEQEFLVSGDYNHIIDISMVQKGSNFTQCVFRSGNMLDLANRISSDINQEASAKSGGFGPIITLLIIAACVIVGIVLVVAIVRALSNRNRERRRDRMMNNQQPQYYAPPPQYATPPSPMYQQSTSVPSQPMYSTPIA